MAEREVIALESAEALNGAYFAEGGKRLQAVRTPDGTLGFTFDNEMPSEENEDGRS
jgi:hypothetical protein